MRLTDIVTTILLTRFNQLSAIPHESSNKTAEIHIHTLDAHCLRIMPKQALLLYCYSIIALYTCKFLKKEKREKKKNANTQNHVVSKRNQQYLEANTPLLHFSIQTDIRVPIPLVTHIFNFVFFVS